jgi:hypothetical protein
MSTITLPSTLRNRIARVGRRVRLLRAVRGLSLLVLVLSLGAAAAVGADLLLGQTLPPAVRAANLGAWAGLGALTLLFGTVVPLCRRLRREDLAAAVEQHYPELGERLTSSVELAERPDRGNGSPALIRLLVEDTSARTHHLDFRPAAPGLTAGALACLAALVLGLLAAPAVQLAGPSLPTLPPPLMIGEVHLAGVATGVWALLAIARLLRL